MTQFLHPSARKGFSSSAELYQQVRPSYPQNIVYWLKKQLNLSQKNTIIDVGAGTGKFIPLIQQITSEIVAVEPIEAMLAQLKNCYPNIQTVQAFSHNLPFSINFADAICCAQSFHWFSNLETLTELYRILKPNGWLILIWNQRDTQVEWVKKIADVIHPFEGNTPRYHSDKWQNVFHKQNLFTLKHQINFPFFHYGTVEQVVFNRLLSTSFIAALPKSQQNQLKQKFKKILRDYVHKTAQDKISFPYITHVYAFQKTVN